MKKLVLEANFAMPGKLVEDTTSDQKGWSLAFQPPVGNWAEQDPNRPTTMIPLKFDEKSVCFDLDIKSCDGYQLQPNDSIDVRGIRYQGVLIVRWLAVVGAPPTHL